LFWDDGAKKDVYLVNSVRFAPRDKIAAERKIVHHRMVARR
jgi:hypothetical protein